MSGRSLAAIAGMSAALLAWPASAFAAQASGDFNGDGRADLAVGVEGQTVSGHGQAGAIHVIYGSPHGLRVKGNQRFVEGSGGVPGSPASFAQFGYSLAAANFGHGKRDDLAIGAVEQTVGATGGAGAVCVLYGAHKGLSSKGSRLWSQDSPGIRDVAESADEFGWSLAAADLGRDRHADLAIGVVTESVGTSN